MEGGCQRGSCREDEALERLDHRLVSIDLRLQIFDVARRDPLLDSPRGRQLGAEVEELALHPPEERIERAGGRERSHHPQMAVEFVHRPEGLDP